MTSVTPRELRDNWTVNIRAERHSGRSGDGANTKLVGRLSVNYMHTFLPALPILRPCAA